MNQTPPSTRFGKTFLVLFALGLPGILSLIPIIMTQLDALPPELAAMPMPALVALSLLNPMILLALGVAIGGALAHRVGLRSLVADKVRHGTAVWPDLRPHIPLAFVAGIIFLLVTIGLDWMIDPFANAEFIAEMPEEGDIFARLLLGVLYGGIVEELMLRWGFMTLLVWIGWRLFQRGEGLPSPAIVWTAIILAALLFGLGHLPALAGLVVLTPILVIRTVLLNALGGLIFGWLFWRYNLETAMVSHAAFHIGLFVVNLIVLVVGG
jgi:membrane protease YdiL (CAAX protease family)